MRGRSPQLRRFFMGFNCLADCSMLKVSASPWAHLIAAKISLYDVA
jgi:hypothetical protein